MRLSVQIQECLGLSCRGKFDSRDEGDTCTIWRGCGQRRTVCCESQRLLGENSFASIRQSVVNLKEQQPRLIQEVISRIKDCHGRGF